MQGLWATLFLGYLLASAVAALFVLLLFRGVSAPDQRAGSRHHGANAFHGHSPGAVTPQP